MKVVKKVMKCGCQPIIFLSFILLYVHDLLHILYF